MAAESRQAALPQALLDEIGNEEILFHLREGRFVSRAGAWGGALTGVLLLVAGAIALAVRGASNVTLQLPFYAGTADDPVGRLALTLAGAAGILAGVGFLVAAPVLRRMPGGIVVGTPSRILRAGRFGVSVGRWRDVESAALGGDGTIALAPFTAGASVPKRVTTLVEIPEASAVFAQIQRLLRPAPTHAAPGSLAAQVAEPVRALRFRTTHTAPRPGRWFGLAFLALGLSCVLAFGGILLSGGTITVSTNGGPEREVGADSLVAWLPVLVGAGFATFGAIFVAARSARRKDAEWVATDEGLSRVASGEDAEVAEFEWRLFEGEIHRKRGRRGDELRLPLRRTTREGGGRERQEILRLVGVSDADAVEAHLRRRLT